MRAAATDAVHGAKERRSQRGCAKRNKYPNICTAVWCDATGCYVALMGGPSLYFTSVLVHTCNHMIYCGVLHSTTMNATADRGQFKVKTKAGIRDMTLMTPCHRRQDSGKS